MQSLDAFSDSLALPLDRARARLFARALRVGALRELLLKKQRRVPALLLTHACLAFGLAVWWPTLLLVVGPLVLGVPHLLADVRHLVLRPSLPRPARPLLLTGAALLLAARVLESLRVPGMARVEIAVASSLVLGAVVVAGRDRPWRALAAALITVSLAAVALAFPRDARLLLGHGHNVVALLLWAALYARSARGAWGTLSVVIGAALVLLLTPLAWFGLAHGLPSAFGLHSLAAADTLAPGVDSASLALGIVSSFAFLQAVHYAVWLYAIPQDATRGEATLSFRMSLRALRADFGAALWLLLAAVVLMPIVGWFAPLSTRSMYLSLSAFHGYLELAAAALFFVRAQGPLAVPSASGACR